MSRGGRHTITYIGSYIDYGMVDYGMVDYGISVPAFPSMADGIPNDGIPIEEMVTIALPLTVVFVILATAGLLFTVVCLAFNFIFRERK